MKQWQHLPIPALTRLIGLCLFIGFYLLTGSLLNSVTVHAHGSTTIAIADCKNDRQLQAAVSTAPSGATIVFRCRGDILLSKTLTITKNLTLDGAGQPVTLDGHGSVQALVVNSGTTFTLESLTIANGSSTAAGGGLFNNGGTVIISNSTISSNTAFAGGGIFNAGSLTISNSTITNNTATSNGGGITNATAGSLTISNSTITNNTTTSNGGGLFNAGSLTISNSTISSNTAFAGGGIFNVGMATINGSLIANNTATVAGGGITTVAGGTVTISNGVLRNNVPTNCAGSITKGNGYSSSGTSCGL